MRIFLSVLLGGCLTIAGLAMWQYKSSHVPSERSPREDKALRQFLGVRTLVAGCNLPQGHEYYVGKIFCFEDGKLITQQTRTISPPPHPTATFRVELLWNEAKELIVSSSDTGYFVTQDSDSFWQKLDGSISSQSSGELMAGNDWYDGWYVLGYACSRLKQEGTHDGAMSLQRALQVYKYVGAVVIRTYKTREEALRESRDE